MKKRAIILIDSVINSCNQTQKEKLIRLYRDAFCDNKDFKTLVSLADRYTFYGVNGYNMHKAAQEIIESGMTEIGNYAGVMAEMKQVINDIILCGNETTRYIEDFDNSEKEISVIDKEFVDTLRGFLTQLMNNVCYMASVLYGADCLKDVVIDVNANECDMIKNYTENICKVMEACSKKSEPKCWCIRRKFFGGKNLIHYKGFTVEGYRAEDLLNGTDFTAVTPYLFIPEKRDDILASGIGNIVSVTPNNGMSILNTETVTKLREDIFDRLDLDYDSFSLVSLINSCFKDMSVTVSPEAITELLNRYFFIKTANERKNANQCIICGMNNCNCMFLKRDFLNEN